MVKQDRLFDPNTKKFHPSAIHLFSQICSSKIVAESVQKTEDQVFNSYLNSLSNSLINFD